MDHLRSYFAQPEATTSLEGVDLEALGTDIEQTAVSCEAVCADVDVLTTAATSLESLQESMEALMVGEDATGMGAQAATFAQGWAQSVMSNVGMPVEHAVSLESFGGEADALEATQVSVEDLKGKLKQIWEAIKNAVSKAIKMIADLLAKIFGGAEKLEKQAKDLADRAGKAKGKAKEKNITVPNAATIAFEGKADAASILKGQETVKEALGVAYGDYLNATADVFSAVAAGTKGDDAEGTSSKLESLGESWEKVTAKLDNYMLPGGKWIVTKVTGSGDSTGNTTGFKIKPMRIEADSSVKKVDAEVPAFSAADVKKMAGLVADNAKTIQGKKGAFEKLGKQREDAMKGVDAAVKAAEAGKMEAAKTKLVSGVLTKLAGRTLERPIGQLSQIAFTTGRGVLAAGEVALKNLDGE